MYYFVAKDRKRAIDYAAMWFRFNFDELGWGDVAEKGLFWWIINYSTPEIELIQSGLDWTPTDDEEWEEDAETRSDELYTNTIFFDRELPQEEIDRIVKLQGDTKIWIRYF